MAQRLFGVLSLLMALAAIGWLAYRAIGRPPSGKMMLESIVQAFLCLALIGVGVRLARRSHDLHQLDKAGSSDPPT